MNEALTLLRVMVQSYTPAHHMLANTRILHSSADLKHQPHGYECGWCKKLFPTLDAFRDTDAHSPGCPWALAVIWLESLETQR